jgi:16S rRNA (cytosine1402-N4)-methyltransferase
MIALAPHIPVLLDEVIHALAITPGSEIVDGTFGAGGYSQAILAGGARVYAFDRDPDALSEGADLAGRSEGALRLYSACFSDLDTVLLADGVTEVDGVVLDIGVSSMQLDRAERGFSFQKDGPLDMRMAQDGMSAADFVNEADEAEIADVIYRYGEEHRSRRIARAIVAARPLTTTAQLGGDCAQSRGP